MIINSFDGSINKIKIRFLYTEKKQTMENTESTQSEKVQFLLKSLGKTNQKQSQKVGQLVKSIKKFNTELSNKEAWLPVANLDRYQKYYEVFVIGFNGKLHPAKVVFETGRDTDSVISSSMVEKASIETNGNNVSYVFIVRIGAREFVGYSLSRIGPYDTSIVEDMCGFSCVTQIENESIDILIGSRTIKEMAKCNINVTANPETIITSEFQTIPHSYLSGLDAEIIGNRIKMHIDTGNFLEEDVTISKIFFEQNKHLFNNVKNGCYGPNGIIPELTICFGAFKMKFIDLNFISMVDLGEIDCVPGINFMKRLIAHRIIVKV